MRRSSGVFASSSEWRRAGLLVIAFATLVALVVAAAPASGESPKRDRQCSGGERFIVRVIKGDMACSNARRALNRFRTHVYETNPPCYPGECRGESPHGWRCQLENEQLTEEPGRMAKCKRQRDGAVGVLIFLGESPTGGKRRDKPCGSFSIPGLMTQVQVKITQGDFRCKIARRVMDDLFHGRDTGHWSCVGPQTGYARCDKSNRGTVVGRF